MVANRDVRAARRTFMLEDALRNPDNRLSMHAPVPYSHPRPPVVAALVGVLLAGAIAVWQPLAGIGLAVLVLIGILLGLSD